MRIFYCDGSAKGNPGRGGFGVCELDERAKKVSYAFTELCPHTTNNREELKGMIHTLGLLEGNEVALIYSDSRYVVDMCNSWIYSWHDNGWKRAKNKDIENLDLVKTLYDLLLKTAFRVKIERVAGHKDILGNELADSLAADNFNKYKTLVKEYRLDAPKNPFEKKDA